ncbi:MAG: YARHG domain-containing protein, partial [Spirochaetales bacterium]|nr:YARHG domain-containing protein [Spirochaetales bacterium]
MIKTSLKYNSAKYILLLVLFLNGVYAHGQVVGFDRIEESGIGSWLTESTEEYQSVYHFGASESESKLVLIIDGSSCYGQIKSGTWSNQGPSWVWTYRNLTNVRIEGNRFYSDLTEGEFILYQTGNGEIPGLKIDEPWSGLTEEGEYEIGPLLGPVENYFAGLYPQASTERLKAEELCLMTRGELKIMRNEIFARYGYQFTPQGEMDNYFRNQS